MTAQQSPQSYILNLITSAKSVLNLSKEEIENVFPDYNFNQVDQNDTNEGVIEIRLNNATLACTLNDQSTCYSSHIFLDDIADMDHYIEYCNTNYIKKDSNSWTDQSNSYLINLNHYREDAYFSFSKL